MKFQKSSLHVDKTGAVQIPRSWSSTFLGNEMLSDARVFYLPDKSLLTEFEPRLSVEGPSAHAHGGFLATILDESMGSCCWYNGLPVLAGRLEVRYRRSVPLDGSYTCQAWLERLDTRRAHVKARIFDDRHEYATSTGLFMRVPFELLKQQSDMARLVEVIEKLKEGLTLQQLIEADRASSSSWQKAEFDLLLDRATQLAGDFIHFASKSIFK